MANHVARELSSGDQVLDVGCGDLRIARHVVALRDVFWTGIDRVDYRATDIRANAGDGPIQFRVHGGRDWPFPAESFDVVMLAFMLHHCEAQSSVIDEAVRVARDRVIVFEATPRNRLEHELAKPYDLLVARGC